MSIKITESILFDLCVETARELVYLSKESDEQIVRPSSRIIFPRYQTTSGSRLRRDGKPRISEQEARQVFCQKVAESPHDLYYSVETPTAMRYAFQEDPPMVFEAEEKGGQSASTDTSVFILQNGRFWQNVNVEFKAHNVEQAHITKDFLKLLAEKPAGLFFHLLESVDSGTLRNKGETGLLDKYVAALKAVAGKVKTHEPGWYLMFAICIMSPGKVLLTKVVTSSDFNRPISDRDFDSLFRDFGVPAKGASYPLKCNVKNWTVSGL